LAPRLVGAWLVAEWRWLTAAELIKPIEPTRFGIDTPKKALLNSSGHSAFYDLVAVAEAAPESFLHEIWPWFASAINEISEPAHPFVVGYRSCHLMHDDFDDADSRVENHIISAFVSAIDGIADTASEKMIQFAEQNAHHELMLVHRLIARGLARSSAATAAYGARYLSEDSRRMSLGNWRDDHGESAALIAAVSAHLSETEMENLEQAVVNWSHYLEDDVKPSKDRIRWGRAHRLRLLRAFPRDKLTAKTRRILDEELRADLGPELVRQSIRMYRVESPVSAEQMRLSKDRDILNLFTRLPDTHERQFGSGPKGGGIHEVASELQALAKSDPERAIRLAKEFKPHINQIPVGSILRGLSESDVEATKVLALVDELVDRGFSNIDFRRDVAWAIKRCVGADAPLPESLFLILEKWLEENPVQPSISADEEAKEYKSDCAILFGYGAFTMLPDGNYPILCALSAACMDSAPPQVGRWLGILTRHANRPESPEVWAGMSRYIAYLDMVERAPAEAFINLLLSMHPGLLTYRQGVHMIASSRLWANSAAIQTWLEAMFAHPSPIARQGAGEILLIQHLVDVENNWTGELLDRLISDPSASSAQVGIAFAVVEFWRESRFRKSAQRILLKLLASNQNLVLQALSGIFFERELPTDFATYQLLDYLMASPEAMQYLNSEDLCEALLSVIDAKPELVGELAAILLSQSIQNGEAGYWTQDTFVTIALRLQELGGQHALCGAAMFEQLLEINSPAAREVTNDLDKRTKNSVSDGWVPHKRRRRIRKSRLPTSG
jgi:hypothetical protein